MYFSSDFYTENADDGKKIYFLKKKKKYNFDIECRLIYNPKTS